MKRLRRARRATCLAALAAITLACVTSCRRAAEETSPSAGAAAPAGTPVVFTVRDGDIAASMAVAPTAIAVGESIGVVLSAEAPPGTTIGLPQPEALAPLELVKADDERRRIDPATGLVKLERRLVVTAWDGGEPTIPALATTFTAADGATRSLTLPEVPLTVTSLVEEPFDRGTFADIHDLPPVAQPSARWPWMLGGIVAIGLGVVAWALLRRRTAPPPPPGPEPWALGALDALAAEGLPSRGLVEPYFVRLVEIVRGYLQRRLGLDVPGLTSEEFLRVAVGDRRFSAAQREPLERLLRFSDLIKFARAAATEQECASAMDAVRGLVAAMRPTEPTPP